MAPLRQSSKPIKKQSKPQGLSLAIQKRKSVKPALLESDKKNHSEVDTIKVQVAKLMKQLKDLQVTQRRSAGLRNNPEEENHILMQLGFDDQFDEDSSLDRVQDRESDPFAELLEKETFDDIREFLIDEDLLKLAYPNASAERIRVEREFQASYYVMKKFLNGGQREKHSDSPLLEMSGSEKDQKLSDRNAFKEFICPICLKLIQRCVTTLCGHSFCDSCLQDYLIFKEVRVLAHLISHLTIALDLLRVRLLWHERNCYQGAAPVREF